MSIDGALAETVQEERQPLKFVLPDLVGSLLSQAVLLEEDELQQFLRARRSFEVGRTKKELELVKTAGVEQHIFTDGKGQIVPLKSEAFKEDVNAWAGKTLRRGPVHQHDPEDEHITLKTRPVEQIEPEDELIYHEEELNGSGYPALTQKIPRPKSLNTLEVARKRAAAYSSSRHR